jgi:hypothetical protein
MRRFTFVLTISLVVASAGSVRAGIYCSLDDLPYPVPKTFEALNKVLANVRSPMNTTAEANPRRPLYVKRRDELLAKQQNEGLTLDDRIELSGVYLRLNEPKGAIKLLEAAEEKDHFLVLTHLATAYHQLNDPLLWERAISYQQRALQVWPGVSRRWNLEQLTWYRRAEQYYLLLLRLRQQETQARKQSWDTVDALFPRLRFESPDGHYEVGGPSRHSTLPTEDAPPDALAVVGQLLYWLPFDNRLTWLYGELLNQSGDAVGAHKALQEIVEVRKERVRPIVNHYRELDKGAEDRVELQKAVWANRRMLLFLARPHTAVPGAGAAELGLEGTAIVGTETAKTADEGLPRFDSKPLPRLPETPQAPAGSWLPDWRTVVVSFAAGMLFMGLVLLQWREWSRRRALSQTPRREVASKASEASS